MSYVCVHVHKIFHLHLFNGVTLTVGAESSVMSMNVGNQ